MPSVTLGFLCVLACLVPTPFPLFRHLYLFYVYGKRCSEKQSNLIKNSTASWHPKLHKYPLVSRRGMTPAWFIFPHLENSSKSTERPDVT